MIWYFLDRLKTSWREYAVIYTIGITYIPLQILFYISHSSAAPYLLAGTCFLYLIVSNLMMRFRFANALVFSLYVTLLAMWFFAGQATGPSLVRCFDSLRRSGRRFHALPQLLHPPGRDVLHAPGNSFSSGAVVRQARSLGIRRRCPGLPDQVLECGFLPAVGHLRL